MDATSQSLECLNRSPLFGGLPESLLREMVAGFQHRRYAKGRVFAAEELGSRFFVIVSGRLKISRSNPDTGRSVVLFMAGPGDGFDLITLLDGQPHEIEHRAMDELELLSAPIDQVRHWISVYPEFNQRFLPYLGQVIRNMENLTSELVLYDTTSRLARLILRHTSTERHFEVPHPPLPVHLITDLRHEDLAQMLGSVRQVVNRHLQALIRKGILHHEKGSLLVKDLRALKSQAGQVLHRLERKRRVPPHG
ncbi:Crp/Fnr family transcriptional regulator [Thiolapillus sp.]